MPREGRGRKAPGVTPEIRTFARRYVELVEALLAEGVPEETARSEARIAAGSILMEEREQGELICPACGSVVR